MQLSRRALPFAILAGLLAAQLPAQAASPDNTMIITLKDGDVTIDLRPDLAPDAVAQLKALVRAHAYDNVAFHRVIDGFMAQTGDVEYGDMASGFDPRLVGTGGSTRANLKAEFTDTPFVRGTVGMARAQDPNSANSQFFIMFALRALARRAIHGGRRGGERHATMSTTSSAATPRSTAWCATPTGC